MFAMAKEAEQRYQTGEELAAALRPFGETPATSTGMNIPAVTSTGGVRMPTQQVPAQGTRPVAPMATAAVAAAAAAPNPHAGGTVQMNAPVVPDGDKTVILSAPPAAAPGAAAKGPGDTQPISAQPAGGKNAPDVDISL